MTVIIELNEEDTDLFSHYAETKKQSLSEAFKQALLERIEDEQDIADAKEALAEYRKNPVSYSLDEIKQDLGLL